MCCITESCANEKMNSVFMISLHRYFYYEFKYLFINYLDEFISLSVTYIIIYNVY